MSLAILLMDNVERGGDREREREREGELVPGLEAKGTPLNTAMLIRRKRRSLSHVFCFLRDERTTRRLCGSFHVREEEKRERR